MSTQFNAYKNNAELRRGDVSCAKSTGAAIYVNCKIKYPRERDTCRHYINNVIYYLSFRNSKNPACTAALYFGFFDNVRSLPEGY